MTSNEALETVKGYASANRIELLQHAKQRSIERRVPFRSIRHALANATRCSAYDGVDDGWRVTGPDEDGDTLVCGVRIENGVVVLTVF